MSNITLRAGQIWKIKGNNLRIKIISVDADFFAYELFSTGIIFTSERGYTNPVIYLQKLNWELVDQPTATTNTNSGGMPCQICQLFYTYVTPNQSDNTYLCYNCRA